MLSGLCKSCPDVLRANLARNIFLFKEEAALLLEVRLPLMPNSKI